MPKGMAHAVPVLARHDPDMLRTLLQRVILSAPVLLGVLLLGFLLLQLVPGDVARVIAGPTATEEIVAQIRNDLGLDRPLVVQFLLYLGRVLQGDLGYSMINNASVAGELAEALWPTAELVIACLVFAIPFGIALGAIAAMNRGRWIDRAIIAFSVIGVSTPVFFFALILMIYLGYHWQLFPFLGRSGPIWTLEGMASLVLPAMTLGLSIIGPIARMTRTSALEVMNADHVRTARAKGLRERTVVLKHVLRNALIPVVTLIGLAGRVPARRRGRHRDDLLLAWRRAHGCRRDPCPRPAAGAGRDPDPRHLLHRHQHGGRSDVCDARSTGEGVMSAVATVASPAAPARKPRPGMLRRLARDRSGAGGRPCVARHHHRGAAGALDRAA